MWLILKVFSFQLIHSKQFQSFHSKKYKTTSITIQHNHPISAQSNMKNWIVFDLGKSRKLDRTTITNAAGNSGTNADVGTLGSRANL